MSSRCVNLPPGAVDGEIQDALGRVCEHLLRALERTGWHIERPRGAAAHLGINPATLCSRVKKLGIRPRRQTEHGSA